MSKDLTNGGVNDGSKSMGDEYGKNLLVKLKLVDLCKRKEAKIKTKLLKIGDGEVFCFMYGGDWIYLWPRDYCTIGIDEKLYYSLALPASVRIYVHYGNRRIIVEAKYEQLINTLLTDEMLDKLRNDYPGGIRNIELVHELDKRFRENPSEIQQMLEKFRAETEDESAKDREMREKI